MSGKKGRTGIAITPAAKATKARATAIREAARHMDREERRAAMPPERVAASDSVERLGQPMTWGDELKKQQVVGATKENQKKDIELQMAQVALARAKDDRAAAIGKLLTRRAHDEAIAELAAKCIERLSLITDAAIGLVSPEAQPAARHAMTHAVEAYRVQVRADIRPSRSGALS
jgi:hypothetical protein